MEDVFEAFCFAVKRDQGYNVVEKFIINVITNNVNMDELANNDNNYKDILLRLFQKNKWGHPTYSIIKQEGPSHNAVFTVGVDYIDCTGKKIKNKYFGIGSGRSKREAEQLASKNTIDILNNK